MERANRRGKAGYVRDRASSKGRALLDVNVLIALLDSAHTSHGIAMGWLAKHGRGGWASCAITQNGCIRVMSNAGYPNALPISLVIDRLAEACNQDIHEFWRDEVSLLDSKLVDATRIHGPRQLTDIYLLALAGRHAGRLVTFDRSIVTTAVRDARPEHLVLL